MTYSHQRKLARAQSHIDYANRLVERWVNEKGAAISMQPDGQGGTELVAKQLKLLPDELGVVIGDALQCLRNSLDNLVFALARKHTPVMAPQDEEDIAFPIYDSAAKVGSKRIKLVDPLAQDDICALAPDPAVNPVNQHPLWLLNKTANRDKHREVATAVTAVVPSKFRMSGNNITLTGGTVFGIFGRQHLTYGGSPVVLSKFRDRVASEHRSKRFHRNSLR